MFRRSGAYSSYKDLLERLITARDQQGNSMSDQQLRDEVLTIFTAGHETTANALSWCWHLLSQHSQFYAPLQAELDQVLAGRTPTAADLSRLPYCRAVLQEAMRLYPPAPVILRCLNSDLILRGYRLEAGTFVFVNLYTIHRHPDFWPEPDRFDPDRFINPAAKPAHPLAYMPFGAGPRARVSGNNLL